MITQRRIPNAEKWTEMYTLSILYDIRKRARSNYTLYLGRVLAEMGYYAHLWCYWKRKWKDKDDIMDIMYNIEAIFEAKLYEAALNNQVNARVAMMGLRRNHGWKEDASAYEAEAEPEVQKPGMVVHLEDRIMVARPGRTETFWRAGESPMEKALLLEKREQSIENNESQPAMAVFDNDEASIDNGELKMDNEIQKNPDPLTS